MTTVDQPAVWTWFHSPLAIRSGDTTFITWHQADGIYIGKYNSSGWETFRLSTVSGPDDHIVAAIGLRTDGRILAVFSEHGGDVRQRISVNAGDISAWGPEVVVHQGECTYPRLEYLSAEERWYLTFRGAGPGEPVRPNILRTSDDDGDTWSAPTDLFQNGTERPYMKMSSNGLDRIDFAVNDAHPQSVNPNATYHFYYDGVWRNSAGADIGSPPFEPPDVTLVDSGHTWIWDVATNGSNPILVYARFPSTEDHRYRYGWWDGAAWVTNEIVAGGGRITIPPDEPYYSGGVTLDHDNPTVAYASRQTGTDVWEINRYQTPDNGSTWSVSPITADSGQKNLRPFVVRNDNRVLWFRGRYDHYFDFDTFLEASPPLTIPDPGPPPPPAPPVAVARIRHRVVWLGCRLTDGRIISEVPDITGQVSRVLGDVTTSGLTLPIPLSGPAALPIGLVEQVTEPGRAMIAAVVNDVPTWAGIVGMSEGGTEDEMSLPVASLEAYLDRRVVRDHRFNQVDEATIAATLVGDAGDIPGIGSGIGLEIDAPPTGTLRDREYLLTDRKTVFEALQELMGVIDGPEWTIDLDWTDETRTAIAKIFRVRKRIGDSAEQPNAVFETTANSIFGSREGSEAMYRYKIDYASGHGANYVVAYSSGEGEDQPSSQPAVAEDVLNAGYPIYEYHFQPSSNIFTPEVLDEHASAELERRKWGTRTFTLQARWDAYPRYGVDWKLGDDIAWKLVGHRHPGGIQGQGRVIGFTLDMQERIIRPILKEGGGS